MIYSKGIFNKEPNLLMRLGDAKTIKKEYDSGIITFSCAANWIDYAVNKNNEVIGDICERAGRKQNGIQKRKRNFQIQKRSEGSTR